MNELEKHSYHYKPNAEGRYQCHIEGCTRTFIHYRDIFRHLWDHIPKEFKPTCGLDDPSSQGEKCTYRFNGRLDRAKEHYHKHHNPNKDQPLPYKWPSLDILCEQYGIAFMPKFNSDMQHLSPCEVVVNPLTTSPQLRDERPEEASPLSAKSDKTHGSTIDTSHENDFDVQPPSSCVVPSPFATAPVENEVHMEISATVIQHEQSQDDMVERERITAQARTTNNSLQEIQEVEKLLQECDIPLAQVDPLDIYLSSFAVPEPLAEDIRPSQISQAGLKIQKHFDVAEVLAYNLPWNEWHAPWSTQ